MTTVGWVLSWVIVAGLFLWQHLTVKKVLGSSEALDDRVYRLRTRIDERVGELERQVRDLKTKALQPSPLAAPPSAGQEGYIPLDLGGSLQQGSSKD